MPAFLGNAARLLPKLGRDRARHPLQVGALPYRRRADGSIEVMLVTSRSSGRWIVPKGWPMAGKTAAEAAEQEAYEEAGVRGHLGPAELGRFSHQKGRLLGHVTTIVAVFPLAVREELAAWPERGERTRCWFGLDEAARAVQSDGLARIIGEFAKTRPVE